MVLGGILGRFRRVRGGNLRFQLMGERDMERLIIERKSTFLQKLNQDGLGLEIGGIIISIQGR